MRRAWGLLLLGVTSACFGSRPELPPADAAPSRDAADATVDAKAPPEPIDCDGLAQRINARPDALPGGACRHRAASCEWGDVCVGGVESRLRCSCEVGEGVGASWRCEATGNTPCRSWADAGDDRTRPTPMGADAPEGVDVEPPPPPPPPPAYVSCDEIQQMFVTTPGPPGGQCRFEGESCEWYRYCLRGRVVNIHCACRVSSFPAGGWWWCTAGGTGTCGDAGDTRVDVGPE